jgi:RNA polymerase sigma-70 factor, ECF subfamily
MEEVPCDPAAETETAALASALRPMVWAAINRLSPDLRTTLILQVYEGLKYREIANVLNISLETVKYRRHQAMLRLREELKGYEV